MSKNEKVRAKVYFIISGVKYWWEGWYGCQLASREWRNVPAGTQRDLFIDIGQPYIRITVFTCKKRWFGYDVNWSISLRGNMDEQRDQIIELQNILKSLV